MITNQMEMMMTMMRAVVVESMKMNQKMRLNQKRTLTVSQKRSRIKIV